MLTALRIFRRPSSMRGTKNLLTLCIALTVGQASAFSACAAAPLARSHRTPPPVVARIATEAVPLPPVSRVTRFRVALVKPLSALWARCDEAVCEVGGWPNPIRAVRRLMPKRRPLDRLQLCEEGTVKVMKSDGGSRTMVLIPPPVEKDACDVSAVMDLM